MGMGMGGMMPPSGNGMGMPGFGSMGMPGTMQNMQNMAMMGNGGAMMNPMMMQGGGMAGGFGNQMMHGGGMVGGFGNNGVPMGEGQAYPVSCLAWERFSMTEIIQGMHPYHYGSGGGVAYGNQPIDQMGNPTFPGGPGRSWYGYGQPRGF
jgi:hypothetical protein